MSNHILKAFRSVLSAKQIDLYVLPRTDQHQSEYLCPCDERVQFLSGFTGSNAISVVSQKEALLWTDPRYYLQAQKQLLEGWTMKKMQEGQPKWFEHILSNYKANTTIEIDGRLISAKVGEQRLKGFEKKGFKVRFASDNLVDEIWSNRPKPSTFPIYLHEQYAGKSLHNKVEWIRNKIIQKQGEAAVFSDLGEIGWILNLRSEEIPFNPFFKSILLITTQGGTLFLPHPDVSLTNNPNIQNHLKKANILSQKYPPILPSKVLCQPNQLNFSMYSQIKQPIEWEGIGLFRAVRSNKQIEGFQRTHVLDGIAMAKFWGWRSNQEEVNQFVASQYLDNLRRLQKNNKGLSFATISGGGSNGAIIHYRATQENSSIVKKNMIHLVDSGGQYLEGTTDVTRAFHFGQPSQEEKDAYTRVLLGNLDIQRLKWPKQNKITGQDIDILARRHLWKKGMDYAHGTGHGVGYFGGVHEGPVGISKFNKTVFEPNMIVTNEPGFYKADKFGIRIENMLVVREVLPGILGFENLTLCPYDKNLMDLSLLNREDVEFINRYHKRVWDTLSKSLQDDKVSLEWLKCATEAI